MRLTLCKLALGLGTTEEGLPILYGLVNAMGRAEYPTSFPRTRLAVELETDFEDSAPGGNVVVQLVDQDGRPLWREEGQFLVPPGQRPGMRQLIAFEFEGQPMISEPGVYRFDVFYAGDVLGSETIRFEYARGAHSFQQFADRRFSTENRQGSSHL